MVLTKPELEVGIDVCGVREWNEKKDHTSPD